LIKTLHMYIGRELAKVTLLSLVAFTLIMTVFGIIEPLRKYGLQADQALALIGCTLPMMMSLTLPIAALFAATIVYGRFSQDNELVACRASGISTVTLLRPAIVLGGIVTLLSLVLSSFVTPQMARTVETAIKANVRSIAYQQLRAKSGIRWKAKDLIIHADRVNEAEDKIEGLVVAHLRGWDDVQFVVAPMALMEFEHDMGDTWVTFYLLNGAGVRSKKGLYDLVETSLPPYPARVPSLAREDPSWYSWPKLLRALDNPTESYEVQQALAKVKQKLCYDMLAGRIAAAVNSGRTYKGLWDQQGQYNYEISAGRAEMVGAGCVELRAAKKDGLTRPVQVLVVHNGQPLQIVSATRGRIETGSSELTLDTIVSIEMLDDIEVRELADLRGRPQQRATWGRQAAVPVEISRQAEAIGLEEIIKKAEEFTNDRKIIRDIKALRSVTIRRLINKIKAEMHMRAAYSLSCLLMVAMGAALGIMLKGGQVISAFAISVVPAALVIVMMIMGKQMARNPDVSVSVGLASIWAGVVALLVATSVIYLHLAKK